MNNEISPAYLAMLLKNAAELGALTALIRTGKIKPYVNKSESFRLYTRKNIESWIKSGLITPRKDGDHSAAWRIDRIEAEAVSKSQKSLHFFY